MISHGGPGRERLGLTVRQRAPREVEVIRRGISTWCLSDYLLAAENMEMTYRNKACFHFARYERRMTRKPAKEYDIR